jgi:hypothetical protein
MSDINQNNQPNLPGFEEYPDMQHSLMPDFGQVVTKRLGDIAKNPSGFDPHALMVKKNDVNTGEVVDDTPTQTWPEKDVKALEDFCKQHGIMGFNCGKMSPVAAMAMLKNMLGVVDGPLAERVPFGYEKLGAKPMIYNQNYPYTTMIKRKAEQKTLLKG